VFFTDRLHQNPRDIRNIIVIGQSLARSFYFILWDKILSPYKDENFHILTAIFTILMAAVSLYEGLYRAWYNSQYEIQDQSANMLYYILVPVSKYLLAGMFTLYALRIYKRQNSGNVVQSNRTRQMLAKILVINLAGVVFFTCLYTISFSTSNLFEFAARSPMLKAFRYLATVALQIFENGFTLTFFARHNLQRTSQTSSVALRFSSKTLSRDTKRNTLEKIKNATAL